MSRCDSDCTGTPLLWVMQVAEEISQVFADAGQDM